MFAYSKTLKVVICLSLYGSPCHDIMGLKGGISVAFVYYDNYPMMFYRVPKFIYKMKETSELSSDAVILYGIILDRASLSRKNEWMDKEGRVYVYLSAEEGASLMRSFPERINECFEELAAAGLIEIKNRTDRDSLIYPKIALGTY